MKFYKCKGNLTIYVAVISLLLTSCSSANFNISRMKKNLPEAREFVRENETELDALNRDQITGIYGVIDIDGNITLSDENSKIYYGDIGGCVLLDETTRGAVALILRQIKEIIWGWMTITFSDGIWTIYIMRSEGGFTSLALTNNPHLEADKNYCYVEQIDETWYALIEFTPPA